MRNKPSFSLDAVPFWALVVALLWAPWPLGSNRPWALGLLAAWLWTFVVVAAAARIQVAGKVPALLRPAGASVPVAALGGFALLAVVQLVPGLGIAGGSISIDRFHTAKYLLTTLTYAGAWLLVLLTVQTAERASLLLRAIVVAGMLQAFVAVMLYSAGGKYELFYMPFEQGERAMGTFPNPDHLAGYLELCLSAGVGYLLAGLAADRGQQVQGWRGVAVTFLNFVMSGKMLVRGLLVVLVVALVMTHSRMGNVAFFASLLLCGCLIAAVSARLRQPALWLVASMAVVDIFIVGQWVGLDRVAQRLEDTVEAGRAEKAAKAGNSLEGGEPPREESLAKRLQVPRLSLALIAERPWLGHGGGTYYTAFPPHKVDGLPWHWDHAHNDYVQVASDMGLVGLLLWVGIGLASGWRCLRLLHDGKTPIAQGLGAAALLALCSLALHTIVDFNLHIPANALTFTVLLAAVWAVPASRGRRRRSASDAG